MPWLLASDWSLIDHTVLGTLAIEWVHYLEYDISQLVAAAAGVDDAILSAVHGQTTPS